MTISLKRFFATLRFAQNDNYLENKGNGVRSGVASSNPIPLSRTITCCHSERSEESLIFLRTVLILLLQVLFQKIVKHRVKMHGGIPTPDVMIPVGIRHHLKLYPCLNHRLSKFSGILVMYIIIGGSMNKQ